METLPKALADEIESLEELDARALKRKYPALLSDAGDCSASGILRSIVAYRLQEKHYGRPLAEDAKSLGGGDAAWADMAEVPAAEKGEYRFFKVAVELR